MSDFKPFAALIFATEVPYFRARLESVSPPFTECLRLPPDFFDALAVLLDLVDEPAEVFFRVPEEDREPLS